MSCTIFHDLNIFTAADPREGSGSQPVIIVLAKSTSESAGPQTARWSVSYLGPLAEFQQGYADRMSRLFSTGGARLARGRLSASDFFRYLNHQIDLAQPLPLCPACPRHPGLRLERRGRAATRDNRSNHSA